MNGLLVTATVRSEIADFLGALLTVYLLLIIAYILKSLYLGFGGRVPYARWSSAAMEFLDQVVEPYLNIFRRFIPPLGPIDLSAFVAIIALQIVGAIFVGIVRG